MTFEDYQRRAQSTDQDQSGENAVIVPLLGLAGETGTLLSSYKKWLRDGEAHRLFKHEMIEDLGDILWYLSNVAEKFGVRLDEVAAANLIKIEDRFGAPRPASTRRFFDDDHPEHERLPRQFTVEFSNEKNEVGRDILRVYRNGTQIGNVLTDNAYEEDGYRYHDAFHFAYATMLGWSPVTRRNLKCKRKSDPVVDSVEDGGRAVVFEESIAALAFRRAKDHDYYRAIDTVDYDILSTTKGLVATQEVAIRTAGEWERAILEGFRIWRLLNDHRGGVVAYDLEQRTLTFKASSTLA